MPTLPQATVQINNSASAFAGGTGYAVVMSCVAQSADSTPRVFASTQDLLTQYTYAPGIDYCAMHFAEAKTPVIFIGLPITTQGALLYQNTVGVTGTSAITVTLGTNGAMEQVQGILTVVQGVNVGTDQIIFNLSLDNGLSQQRIRLGANTSYTIPFVGIVLNFGAGTLNVGDVFKFGTTAPMWGSTAMSLARTNLAAQQNLARSWLVCGDLPSSVFAGYVTTELGNYETTNQRYVYARAQVQDRILAQKNQIAVQMTGAPALSFVAAAHTITRTGGSFITDGFVIGQLVTISGSTSNNGVVGVLTAVSATVLTFGSGVVNETDAAGSPTVITGSEAITFAAAGFTITRSGSSLSFLTEGFAVGQTVTIAGTSSNNTTLAITAVTATVMTFASGIVNEGPDASSAVSIVQAQTQSAYVAAETAAFASVDALKRIDLGIGKGNKASPITGWLFRRPSSWAASLREYQHDIQIPTYLKADGPLSGWSMTDANGNLLEFDERVYGGGLAGRFTCFRSYGNGPLGAFIALSLTRDSEGNLLSRTHNMAVANLASTVVQAETENAIGQVLILNANGTGTDASLSLIEQRVNSSLQVNLLQTFKEGKRASSAVWTASRTDILNVPGATLNGTLLLNLNGTIEKIATVVNIQTAGQ